MIFGWFIFPLSALYNYFVNNILRVNNYTRIVAAILFRLFIGCLLNLPYHFGEYIGEYQAVKNFMVLALSGILIELLRIRIIKLRS
jgi:hypothetical protein